jgi:ubiquinone/menaquinone biosynthesis C-methylase UbiE
VDRQKLANYNTTRGAESYKQEYELKLHRKYSDALERKIYTRLLGRLAPIGLLLDLPCGAGRLFPLLRSHATGVVESDWSFPMLELNARDHDRAARAYVRCSALRMPFRDRCMDVAVSVRLSHHIDDPKEREQHLRELFRVADRGVLVTYFSHHSFKNVLRRLRAPFTGKRPKNTMVPKRVAQIAADSGFTTVDQVPLSRLGSGHVFALFQRAR